MIKMDTTFEVTVNVGYVWAGWEDLQDGSETSYVMWIRGGDIDGKKKQGRRWQS